MSVRTGLKHQILRLDPAVPVCKSALQSVSNVPSLYRRRRPYLRALLFRLQAAGGQTPLLTAEADPEHHGPRGADTTSTRLNHRV